MVLRRQALEASDEACRQELERACQDRPALRQAGGGEAAAIKGTMRLRPACSIAGLTVDVGGSDRWRRGLLRGLLPLSLFGQVCPCNRHRSEHRAMCGSVIFVESCRHSAA